MSTMIEILSLLLLFDIGRRIHAAREHYRHPQIYHAWMVFVAAAIATLVCELGTAAMRDAGWGNGELALLNTIAVGARVASVSSLWIALVISLPGTMGHAILDASRTATSSQPLGGGTHPRDDSQLRRVE